jgi:hypothetical protein
VAKQRQNQNLETAKIQRDTSRSGELGHLQDFAASLGFLLSCDRALAQEFAHKAQGFNLFLETF